MSGNRSDRALLELLGSDASELDRSTEAVGVERVALPTLDERVEMFLRAVHGSDRSFTATERASARDRILQAMAADIADSLDGPVPRVAAAPAVPQVREAPQAEFRASTRARPSATSGLADKFRGFLELLMAPLNIFSAQGMRMVAAPLVALLMVGTVTTMYLQQNPQFWTEDGPPAVEGPTTSKGKTRALGPVLDPQQIAAEERLKKELAATERKVGPSHADVAEVLGRLASLYQSQGRFAEAETTYQRVLALREKALGPAHPAVAETLNQLARLYRTQGRTREARELARRADMILESAQPR